MVVDLKKDSGTPGELKKGIETVEEKETPEDTKPQN